jgi:hypothetical protein
MAKTTFSGPVRSENGFVSIAASGKTLALQAPANLSADTTLTFPNGAGSNGQYLKTDGTGALSWAAGDGTGTVTSVGGTGTISGISLSGTVTTAGNLTLGGALDLSSPPAIGGTAAAAGTFTNLAVSNRITGAIQPLDADGAVSLTTPITTLTTGGEDPLALTLADGTAGQIKIITMIVDGGEDAVVTPATPLGFTTLTFGDEGDGVTLVYTASGWVIVGNNGVAI